MSDRSSRTHKHSTDVISSIEWRIEELKEDIQIIKLYAYVACAEALPGYELLIDICEDSIKILQEKGKKK